VEEFSREFDAMCRPLLLQGLIDDWPAWRDRKWGGQNLSNVKPGTKEPQNSTGERLWWVCGARVNRWQRLMIQMTLKEFFEYCDAPLGAAADLEPLDVFEMEVPAHLEGDYSVPSYFKEDKWDLLPHFVRKNIVMT